MMFFDMVVENWVIVLNCGRCDSEDIEKGTPWEILGNHVQSDSVSNRLFVQNMQVLTGPQNGCYGNGFKNISIYNSMNKTCPINVVDYPIFGLCAQ